MGATAPSTADRRVRRTREALRAALVALIEDRGWDGFGVQELCERANVGRSTFYTHFADKEELVSGSFADLGRAMRAQVRAPGVESTAPLAFARGLIEHGHEQRRLFLAIVGKRSGLFVYRKFRELVLELVREDLSAVLPAGPGRDSLVAFVAGGFLEVLTWSLEARSPPSPAETHARFRELVDPVLAAAPRPAGAPPAGGAGAPPGRPATARPERPTAAARRGR